jgi:hypothetical protein
MRLCACADAKEHSRRTNNAVKVLPETQRMQFSLLVAQRLHGIEPGGTTRRIKAGKQADDE